MGECVSDCSPHCDTSSPSARSLDDVVLCATHRNLVLVALSEGNVVTVYGLNPLSAISTRCRVLGQRSNPEVLGLFLFACKYYMRASPLVRARVLIERCLRSSLSLGGVLSVFLGCGDHSGRQPRKVHSTLEYRFEG